MTATPTPFAHAEHTADRWLAVVARHLGTEDRHHAYRVLRAWLHVVRDRLTADSAAHLGAQLPELLRGLFYEGWQPSQVPQHYDVDEFTRRVAHEAGIAPADVQDAVTAVTEALAELFSPGQLDHALAALPLRLRDRLTEPDGAAPDRDAPGAGSARLGQLEHTVDLLTRAVTELAHGLEPNPLDQPNGERAARAARAVHQLLLTRHPAG